MRCSGAIFGNEYATVRYATVPISRPAAKGSTAAAAARPRNPGQAARIELGSVRDVTSRLQGGDMAQLGRELGQQRAHTSGPFGHPADATRRSCAASPAG